MKRVSARNWIVAPVAAVLFSVTPVYADLQVVDSTGNEVAFLTDADIDALPQNSILVENEHEDGLNEYSGPLARDVLAAVGGLESESVILTAINDYAVTIPVSDFMDYPVIFATSMNGDKLSARDKGPIWVMYPLTDYPELQSEAINSRLIWQLVKMEIE